jgi:hypothetical protein
MLISQLFKYSAEVLVPSILLVLCYYFYGLLFQKVKRPPWTVEVGNARPGEGRPRRSFLAKEGLCKAPNEKMTTLYSLMEIAAEKYGENKCMGFRPIKQTYREKKDGKEYEYYELENYVWQNYR